MLFWTLIALLTAAAILAVLLPLGRAPRAASSAAHARQVYLDQLDELERDKAQGRLSGAEAEASRAEIARRLIALGDEAGASVGGSVSPGGSLTARRVVSVVALAGIPILSLSLYLTLGAPTLPGAPLAARLDAPASADDVETLLARVERHLAETPEDGRGWEVIAPVYLRLGRAEDAANAFRNAIRLLGSTAERQAKLGEAIWMAEGGIVTADARAAFEAANELDPDAPEPRFFLALAARQGGDDAAARQRLTALLADTPADAPWRETVVAALAGLEGNAAPSGPEAGPAADDVAAAQTMPEEQQTAMIEGMVSGLAARLQDDPDNADGWLRLIRSYVVLGRTEAAAEAAREALAGVTEPSGRARVEALIGELGVAPAEATP